MARNKKIASNGRPRRRSAPSAGETGINPPFTIEFVFNRPPKRREHGDDTHQEPARVDPDPPKRIIFDFRE